MPLPSPEPGLVLCYEFLWSHEHAKGEQYGVRKRPCAVILATKTDAGQTSVIVAPITHREPFPPDQGIEIPFKVKQNLGLDSERSWIIIDELNQFVWPGLDLYPVWGGRPDQFDFGFLPPLLFDRIVRAISELDANLKSLIVRTG
jgi:hypothetical protein